MTGHQQRQRLRRRVNIDGELDWSDLPDEERDALSTILAASLEAAWDTRDRLLDEYLAEPPEKPDDRHPVQRAYDATVQPGEGRITEEASAYLSQCPPGTPLVSLDITNGLATSIRAGEVDVRDALIAMFITGALFEQGYRHG